jgi:transposase
MQVVHARCCGLDVHKKAVTACVLLTAPDGTVRKHVRTFTTMTCELLALDDWLGALGVTHVAMESTGVYWRPVFALLEAERDLLLVNPQHIKAVPGRKTDVRDAEWLAELLRHGLLRGSFVPPAPIRELRELTRYRKQLVQQRTQEVNRLHAVLETANLKLAVVATNVLGVSGRAMLAALLGGEQDPDVLAELACGRLRAKLPALREALTGRVTPHHLVLLERILAHIDFLEESIAAVQDEVERALAPEAQAVALLQTIPGVGPVAAATIVAEIGTDMRRFPSAGHLASWAGLCPGNRESAGKQQSGKMRPGNAWLKGVLAEVAWGISRLREQTYLAAQFHRIARRRGRRKAVMAVAHSVLVIAYHLLRDQQPYRELGADYFDKRDQTRLQRHYVARLSALGYQVDLTPSSAEAGFS